VRYPRIVRRHLLHASLLLTLFAGSFPAATVASAAPRYLPLAEGNRWLLQNLEGSGAQTISVGRGTPGLVLRGLPGAGDLRVRAVGQAVQAWDPASRAWEPFLRLDAAAGTKYAVALSTAPLWRSLIVTVASRQAVVEDARGRTLSNCVRLTFAARKPIADSGLEELVFAPGVGFASTSAQTIAGPRELLLVSARLR
jgi:hypothetical protein